MMGSESEFRMVGMFHRKFGLPAVGDGQTRPGAIDSDAFLFRYQFLQEELQELLAAYRRGDLPGMADALVDLIYVAHGTGHLMGLPLDEVFMEVQLANMRKERASSSSDARSKRGSGLDVVKPEGWTPPDVEGVLRRHGWEG